MTAPASTPTTAVPLRGTTKRLTGLRKIIARRMVESLQVSAQLTSVVEVDLSRIVALRQQTKEEFRARHGVKLTYLPFMARAAVEALRTNPTVNASLNAETNEVTYFDTEHLAVAVDTDKGLLVPVIRDAGERDIAELAVSIADLADRARRGKLTPDEMNGGTFTITNTGSRGALFDTPIINQPQSAILGTGAVVHRPVAVAAEAGGFDVKVRPMAYLALSYDHRLVDGADAARYVSDVKTGLEQTDYSDALGL